MDAVEILERRYFRGKPELQILFAEEEANLQVARKVYELRKRAGLSQRALAKLIGVTVNDIGRLENADYEGHALAMLRRIATALKKRVEIRFVQAKTASGKS